MLTATETTNCPLCEGEFPTDAQQCPHCHASAAWADLQRAADFARRQFGQWSDRRVIHGEQWTKIEAHYVHARAAAVKAVARGEEVPADNGLRPADECWDCGNTIETSFAHCWYCGAPADAATRDELRHLDYLSKEIDRLQQARLIWTAQCHACQAEVKGRAAALRAGALDDRIPAQTLARMRMERLRKLKEGGPGIAPPPLPASSPPPPTTMTPTQAWVDQQVRFSNVQPPPPSPAVAFAPPPSRPRRSVMEILLDPRSIQWLLASGGVLLVAGLVIWLASLGVFKDPTIVAAVMGLGTLGLLGGGWAIILRSRYQLAGRAITLLACLVMPLNLWFYNSHHLVTVDGHLWLAGLVCCALYAASAWVLEDALFVYVLTAGVAMTGLLMLADLYRFAEIAAPSTLLVVMGLIALHLERAFPQGEGPFNRKRFGMAFFWSAQALLAAGLLMLLGAQIAGWLYAPFMHDWLATAPRVFTDPALRWWALALVAAGTYAYLYSDLVVRRVGVYVYFAAFTLLWAELLVIDLLGLSTQPAALIVALSLTGLAANLLARLTGTAKLARPLPPLALCLSFVPVLLGVLMHLRATEAGVHDVWRFSVTIGYVVAMLVTAACCRIGAYLYRLTMPRMSATYLFGSAAATLVGAAGLLSVVGLETWDQQAPLLMLVPIGYLLASRLYHGHPSAEPLAWVAHTATAVMIASVLGSALHITPRVIEPVIGQHLNLLLALFCAEAALFYALAAILRKQGANVYLFTVMACGALWQLLNYASLSTECYPVAFAALGMALLIAYRFSALEKFQQPILAQASFQCANALMSLSFVASVLIALSRLAADDAGRSSAVWLLALLAATSLGAAFLVRHSGWKRWYVTVAIAQGALACVNLERLLELTAWQNAEIFCVAIGVILLLAGHIGWYREQDSRSDMVSHNLLLGSLLAGLPLAIAALASRIASEVSLPDEMALLTVGILLFVSGFLLRIRSTTITGGALLAVQLAMMLVFIGMQAQLAVGVYLAAGGAVVFGAGLLLSIYRDRLMELPQRIKSRQGIFKVLGWR